MVFSSCDKDQANGTDGITQRSSDGPGGNGQQASITPTAAVTYLENEMNFRHAIFNKQYNDYSTHKEEISASVNTSGEISGGEIATALATAKTMATQHLTSSSFTDPLARFFDFELDRVENNKAYFKYTIGIGNEAGPTYNFSPFTFSAGQDYAATYFEQCQGQLGDGAPVQVCKWATHNSLGAIVTSNLELVATEIDEYFYEGDVHQGYPSTLNSDGQYYGWNDSYDLTNDYFTDFKMWAFSCDNNCDDFFTSSGNYTTLGADVFCIEHTEMNIYLSNAEQIAALRTADTQKSFVSLQGVDAQPFSHSWWSGIQHDGVVSTRPIGYSFDDLGN